VAGLVVGGGCAEVPGPVSDGEVGAEGGSLGVCGLGLVIVEVPARVAHAVLGTVEVGGGLVDVDPVPDEVVVGSVEVLFGVLQCVAGGAAEGPLGELDGAGCGPAALLLELGAVGVELVEAALDDRSVSGGVVEGPLPLVVFTEDGEGVVAGVVELGEARLRRFGFEVGEAFGPGLGGPSGEVVEGGSGLGAAEVLGGAGAEVPGDGLAVAAAGDDGELLVEGG
jgi:hypothetical protein